MKEQRKTVPFNTLYLLENLPEHLKEVKRMIESPEYDDVAVARWIVRFNFDCLRNGSLEEISAGADLLERFFDATIVADIQANEDLLGEKSKLVGEEIGYWGADGCVEVNEKLTEVALRFGLPPSRLFLCRLGYGSGMWAITSYHRVSAEQIMSVFDGDLVSFLKYSLEKARILESKHYGYGSDGVAADLEKRIAELSNV
ncbi:hypothetical protein HYS10_00815 [Candidatus Collierbacteria bacterium]|nr:hypothetical protein [Candidatus Collierbacteria bacterium]